MKIKTQIWIVAIGFALMLAKAIAWLLTDSVGVLTDAMESIVNVSAGLLSLYALWMAAKPQDKQHPFGHGKAELISASAEGIMIFGAGALIIYEGIMRLLSPEMPQKLDIGIVIIAAAGVVNYIMGWWSIRMGRRTNSVAMIAGGKHLKSDTYSTIGLVLGLVLLYVTKLPWIDSALAFVFGAIIMVTGVNILRGTIGGLMDEVDTELLGKMVTVLNENRAPEWIDIHDTKIIKGGNHLFVDCDLTMPWYYNLRQGHKSIEQFMALMEKHFEQGLSINVHTDACDADHCAGCSLHDCPVRSHPFEALEELNMSNISQLDTEHHPNGFS
ncbi:MAG: cation diffusion facilitator family transporter [Mucinivorans sp.]